MKMVMAIIKPFKLDDVREALSDAGVVSITAPSISIRLPQSVVSKLSLIHI